MRELERIRPDISSLISAPGDASPALAVVGAGRVGGAIAAGLRRAGVHVAGPLRRGERVPGGATTVLLCVPDREIPSAAAALGPDVVVGHTSGITPIAALGQTHAFGLHPLQTITGPGTDLAGATCAIAGTTEGALARAFALAQTLGMDPFEIEDGQRPAYHAAASIASNFLLTLEASAEDLLEAAGIERADARRMLRPLVEATVRGWVERGPQAALTGPVARGDERTVAIQRAAVEELTPESSALFDALTDRTRALARGRLAA